MAIDPKMLMQAIRRRMAPGATPPVANNLISEMQGKLSGATPEQAPDPANLIRMLMLAKQGQPEMGMPEQSLQSGGGIMSAMPVGQPTPIERTSSPITKLPQQHSQIGVGLQEPYQAIGQQPGMQQAAQNRIQKAGARAGQGNYAQTLGGGTSGFGGGGEQGQQPKQQKHRKVTIEEYR